MGGLAQPGGCARGALARRGAHVTLSPRAHLLRPQEAAPRAAGCAAEGRGARVASLRGLQARGWTSSGWVCPRAPCMRVVARFGCSQRSALRHVRLDPALLCRHRQHYTVTEVGVGRGGVLCALTPPPCACLARASHSALSHLTHALPLFLQLTLTCPLTPLTHTGILARGGHTELHRSTLRLMCKKFGGSAKVRDCAVPVRCEICSWQCWCA